MSRRAGRGKRGVVRRRRERERAGGRDEALLGGQAVEEPQALEVAARRARSAGRGAGSPRRPAPERPDAAASSRTIASKRARAGLVRPAQQRRDLGRRAALPHRPEGEDERVPGERAPLGGEVEHDVAVQPRLQGGIADDEPGVRRPLGSPPRGTPASSPYTRLSRIRVSAAEVRDAGSRTTERILSRDDVRDEQHRAHLGGGGDAERRHDPRPGIRWYSIEGISPTSASPEASFAAQTEGMSRETATPGGGSWSRPQVRGRAFRKSTTEMRQRRRRATACDL